MSFDETEYLHLKVTVSAAAVLMGIMFAGAITAAIFWLVTEETNTLVVAVALAVCFVAAVVIVLINGPRFLDLRRGKDVIGQFLQELSADCEDLANFVPRTYGSKEVGTFTAQKSSTTGKSWQVSIYGPRATDKPVKMLFDGRIFKYTVMDMDSAQKVMPYDNELIKDLEAMTEVIRAKRRFAVRVLHRLNADIEGVVEPENQSDDGLVTLGLR